MFNILLTLCIACNDEKRYSNDKADTRDYNTVTKDESGATGIVTNDTTSTMNNNAYNTDSASGKRTSFDTSAKR